MADHAEKDRPLRLGNGSKAREPLTVIFTCTVCGSTLVKTTQALDDLGLGETLRAAGWTQRDDAFSLVCEAHA